MDTMFCFFTVEKKKNSYVAYMYVYMGIGHNLQLCIYE